MAKYVEPNVEITAFNCPHCGALASQNWYNLHGAPLNKGHIPAVWTLEQADTAAMPDGAIGEKAEKIRASWRKMASAHVYLFESTETVYDAFWLVNFYASKCFNCDEVAVWHHDRIAWPKHTMEIPVATDMPDDVRADFEEAALIVDHSPRGAAALLRLSIQKLCGHVGGEGKNINDDIKVLVSQGLDPRVQQALDVVRVIGNNAVHPGEIDISDDRTTARQLFDLVNLIVEIMITQPAQIAQMYASLPAGALAAINRRDQ